MSEENGGAVFLVEHVPREVIIRADRYMLNQGFIVGLNRTATTTEYTMFRQKGCLGRLLMLSPDFYRVRLSARKEERGPTSLSLKTSQKGRWSDIRSEIEQWITEELGGTLRPE
jgi:hypothetical protein